MVLEDSKWRKKIQSISNKRKELTTFVPIESGGLESGDLESGSLESGGGRRFKVEEEVSKWG